MLKGHSRDVKWWLVKLKVDGEEDMPEDLRQHWAGRLDSFCAVAGALLPVGVVVGNAGFELVIVMVCIAWVARCLVARDNPLPRSFRNPLVLPWLAWYLIVIASLLWNGAGSKGWAHDVVFFRQLLYVAAMLDVSLRRPLLIRNLLYGLAVAVILAAINTLVANMFGSDLMGKPLARYANKLKEISRISAICSFAAPIFMAWSFYGEGKGGPRKKTIFWVMALLAVVLLLYAHIRTALLAGAAGIVVVFLFRLKPKHLVAASLMLIVSAVIGYSLLPDETWTLTTLYDRVAIWKVCWAMWLDSPLLGVGVSAYPDAYQQMAASGVVKPFVAPNGREYFLPLSLHAHSLFFMLLASTGILGVAAFGWLLGQCGFQTVKSELPVLRVMMTAWLVVLLVGGLAGWSIYAGFYQALVAFFVVMNGAGGMSAANLHAAVARKTGLG